MEQDKIDPAAALQLCRDALATYQLNGPPPQLSPPIPDKPAPPPTPPPTDPTQFTELELQTIVDLELRKRPLFDPSKSFCSDANLDRVNAIHDFLCTMPAGEARDHLVFCYHLLNSGIIENGKLKKRLREFAEDKVREHLKSNHINFRRHQLG